MREYISKGIYKYFFVLTFLSHFRFVFLCNFTVMFGFAKANPDCSLSTANNPNNGIIRLLTGYTVTGGQIGSLVVIGNDI